MPNQYYAPGEHRAAKVNDLFDTIAPRYDLINDLQSFGLHRLWKRRLVRLAELKPGDRALDLCCGTGDVAFAMAGQGAEVTGLDASEAMLAVARNRAEKVPQARGRAPQFLRGDALEIPFPEESFDVVTVSYGLRNLSSWESGLGEMFRVARRGGRLLVLDFGKPDNAVWRAFYFGYLRACVPLFGKLFCGDSQTHAYILESLRHYPAQHGVLARMRELGCRGARIVPLLGGVMTINHGVKP
jgi:demethylmenaquinone methyltransferase / 2-methoxy-6-polyprenyl-1,4-benzoquinol methylase